MKWMDLAQEGKRRRAFLNAVLNLRVPQYAGNFLTSRGPLSFSGTTLLHGISYSCIASGVLEWPVFKLYCFSTQLTTNIYVLLTVHLSISLDNDQLDTLLLYFTIRPLQSSTWIENYMLIIRRLKCIDAASGIVLSVSGRPLHRCTVAPYGHWLWGRYQMLHQYNSTPWWWAGYARKM